MAAPTNAAYVKKALANSEPSTHGLSGHVRPVRATPTSPESTSSSQQTKVLRSNFGEEFRSCQKRIRFSVLTIPAL